jgi:hypothetical protein
MANPAGVQGRTIAFGIPGRFRATASLDAANLIERVEATRQPCARRHAVTINYSDYRLRGVKFPKIRQTYGGHPALSPRRASHSGTARFQDVPIQQLKGVQHRSALLLSRCPRPGARSRWRWCRPLQVARRTASTSAPDPQVRQRPSLWRTPTGLHRRRPISIWPAGRVRSVRHGGPGGPTENRTHPWEGHSRRGHAAGSQLRKHCAAPG